MPPIPGPLQRLFDHFPLATYPANELPARSPRPSSLPTLYIFASEEDAARGNPSFNPSCLKWQVRLPSFLPVSILAINHTRQTLLRLSRLPHLTSPSTNHASPTGTLPFLLPPIPPVPSIPPRPIPATNLERYLATLPAPPTGPSSSLTPTSSLAPDVVLKQEPYLSLLSGPVRAAWLTALYLDTANTHLLSSLYIDPASTSPLVRAALLRQLRSAAEAEVLRILAPTVPGSGSGWKVTVNAWLEFGPGASRARAAAAAIDAAEIYARAADAFEALAVLLRESPTGWFFGVEQPGLFDAAVFAYTFLVGVRTEREGGKGLEWEDGGRLERLVAAAGEGELVRHRERVWELGWGGDDREGKGE